MTGNNEFRPMENGWNFKNTGGFSPSVSTDEDKWDLYRKSYMGIHPEYNAAEAPLDYLFFDTCFRNINSSGNCGGMSLLALAIYKYGGYMGFCSPASSYYSDTDTLDMVGEKLHEAINIMQARQFSAPGVENFIDVSNEGILNSADTAFSKIKGYLSQGDYPILNIANSLTGDAAHTVIPYKVEGTSANYPKSIYVWDPNHPYDDDLTHYASQACQLKITSSANWSYTSGGTTYSGSPGSESWCFAVPMSLVLRKARQPMSLDMALAAVQTFVIQGPGAAVSQIKDKDGRRFYKSEADQHRLISELESNPTKKIEDTIRWPWFGQQANGEIPYEVYFSRQHGGSLPLTLTISGANYTLRNTAAGNLLEINSKASTISKEKIKITGLSTPNQAVEVKSLKTPRSLTITQIRAEHKGKKRKVVRFKEISVPRSGLIINMNDNLAEVELLSGEKEFEVKVETEERVGGKVYPKHMFSLSTTSGRIFKGDLID